MDVLDELERAREFYRRRAWGDAYQLLSTADHAAPLGGDDLERLAMSAYLLGRDDDYLEALDRAHRTHLESGDEVRAARCAFWLGFRLAAQREMGRSGGWLARAGGSRTRARLRREGLPAAAGGHTGWPRGDCEAALRRGGRGRRERRPLRRRRPERVRAPPSGPGCCAPGAGRAGAGAAGRGDGRGDGGRAGTGVDGASSTAPRSRAAASST